MFSHQSNPSSNQAGFIGNLRTLFSLKGSRTPDTGDMVEWMHRLNREIPGLDTLVVRLEKIEQLKNDMKELADHIRSFSTLYERICADYAELLQPLAERNAPEEPAKHPYVQSNVEFLPAEVVEQLQPLRNKLVETSHRKGNTRSEQYSGRYHYEAPKKIRYRIKPANSR